MEAKQGSLGSAVLYSTLEVTLWSCLSVCLFLLASEDGGICSRREGARIGTRQRDSVCRQTPFCSA